MNIYFIAGPPGIGKSTYGRELVPAQVPIIDHDLAAYQYKKQGFSDYSELASLKANELIKNCLATRQDFALELNLGYQSHYDYLKSVSSNKFVRIHLILFFTNDVNLCLLRADIRYKNGGHLVNSKIIIEMYNNTLPLLKQNLKLFSSITFISVFGLDIEKVNRSKIPKWIIDDIFLQYIKE